MVTKMVPFVANNIDWVKGWWVAISHPQFLVRNKNGTHVGGLGDAGYSSLTFRCYNPWKTMTDMFTFVREND